MVYNMEDIQNNQHQADAINTIEIIIINANTNKKVATKYYKHQTLT